MRRVICRRARTLRLCYRHRSSPVVSLSPRAQSTSSRAATSPASICVVGNRHDTQAKSTRRLRRARANAGNGNLAKRGFVSALVQYTPSQVRRRRGAGQRDRVYLPMTQQAREIHAAGPDNGLVRHHTGHQRALRAERIRQRRLRQRRERQQDTRLRQRRQHLRQSGAGELVGNDRPRSAQARLGRRRRSPVQQRRGAGHARSSVAIPIPPAGAKPPTPRSRSSARASRTRQRLPPGAPRQGA